jgi:hypothetical protein
MVRGCSGARPWTDLKVPRYDVTGRTHRLRWREWQERQQILNIESLAHFSRCLISMRNERILDADAIIGLFMAEILA